MMKILLVEMMEESGVEMLLHALAVDAVVEGDEVKGVIVESKSGRQAILADVVIDCTGDGDVAVAAGCDWEKATGDLLPMAYTVVLGGIDVEKAKPYRTRGSPEQIEIFKKAIKDGWSPQQWLPRTGDERVTGETKSMDVGRLHRPLLPLGHWHASDFTHMPNEVVEKYWQRKVRGIGEATGACHHQSYGDCSDVRDLTEAEISQRKWFLPALKWVKENVPGYENAYIAHTPVQVGLRESRRITGDYVLTWDGDVQNCLKHEDVINLSRPPAGPAFDVPYRCLVPRKIDGILTAGRCISMDHKLARLIAMRDEVQATALGEASGTAAALAVRRRVKPRELDVPTLQETLRKQGLNVPKR